MVPGYNQNKLKWKKYESPLAPAAPGAAPAAGEPAAGASDAEPAPAPSASATATAVKFAGDATAVAAAATAAVPEQPAAASREDIAAAAAAARRAERRAARAATVDANELTLEDAAQEVLMKLDRWMKLHSFRVVDLFRRKDINADGVDDLSIASMGTSFLDKKRPADGADALDVDEFGRLVARLPNVKISRPQVAALVRRLDRDRSGMLTVDEMEKALRDARMKNRGIEMRAHARARDALDHKQLGGVLPELLQKAPSQRRSHITMRRRRGPRARTPRARGLGARAAGADHLQGDLAQPGWSL